MKKIHKFTAVLLAALMLSLSLMMSVNAANVDLYGRKRGLPVPYGVSLPERSRTPEGYPGDEEHPGWDGYYKIYFFQADDSWFENADKKEEGFEIGVYWYYGTESAGEWPGVPAKRVTVPGMKNIFYSIVPSYANNIIWNNGIDEGLSTDKDYDVSKKGMGIQTTVINVEDDLFNQLYTDDLCGCLCYPTEKEPDSSLTSERKQIWKADWKYFDPRIGKSGTESLMVDGKVMRENGFPMNPYYDMDYSYPCVYDFKLSDALALQKHLAGITDFGDYLEQQWDLDDNGKIDLNDVLIIQRTLAQM